MDALHIFVLDQVFNFPKPLGSLLCKKVKHLSKLEFDGEGLKSDFDHFYAFQVQCRLYKIANEHEGCMLFSLTFHEIIRSWFDSLPANVVHNWEYLVNKYLEAFNYYDYDQLCD